MTSKLLILRAYGELSSGNFTILLARKSEVLGKELCNWWRGEEGKKKKRGGGVEVLGLKTNIMKS